MLIGWSPQADFLYGTRTGNKRMGFVITTGREGLRDLDKHIRTIDPHYVNYQRSIQ